MTIQLIRSYCPQPKLMKHNQMRQERKRKQKLTFMSRWRTCWRWMNWMPSQICRMKMAHALSVSTKSSSITRSKSSPPSMLSRAPRKREKCKRKQISGKRRSRRIALAQLLVLNPCPSVLPSPKQKI